MELLLVLVLGVHPGRGGRTRRWMHVARRFRVVCVGMVVDGHGLWGGVAGVGVGVGWHPSRKLGLLIV